MEHNNDTPDMNHYHNNSWPNHTPDNIGIPGYVPAIPGAKPARRIPILWLDGWQTRFVPTVTFLPLHLAQAATIHPDTFAI